MDSLVGALVRFMDAYYSRAELQGIVDDMVAELRAVDPPMRLVYQLALEAIQHPTGTGLALLSRIPATCAG